MRDLQKLSPVTFEARRVYGAPAKSSDPGAPVALNASDDASDSSSIFSSDTRGDWWDEGSLRIPLDSWDQIRVVTLHDSTIKIFVPHDQDEDYNLGIVAPPDLVIIHHFRDDTKLPLYCLMQELSPKNCNWHQHLEVDLRFVCSAAVREKIMSEAASRHWRPCCAQLLAASRWDLVVRLQLLRSSSLRALTSPLHSTGERRARRSRGSCWRGRRCRCHWPRGLRRSGLGWRGLRQRGLRVRDLRARGLRRRDLRVRGVRRAGVRWTGIPRDRVCRRRPLTLVSSASRSPYLTAELTSPLSSSNATARTTSARAIGHG